MHTKEQAYDIIAQLTKRFEDQIDNYKRNYNETQTRLDFINPFFEALGWDMNNKAGAWEAYREVIHEDKLKAGNVTTAPDYSFRLVGGQRLFFVEAKKPSVIIKDDVAPAYQVRLYGWNAKLAISVVTDFEEFAVYQCSKKPLRTDKASTARINYFTYKDYLKEFDFFWNTFSKEEIIKGGLIKFQKSDKKGTATVDKDFLEKLDLWRKELAANIYKNNPEISEDDLNFSVQQTIDRIIFLRIAEDRGLEPYEQLKSCLQNQEQYKELHRQFRIADDKYNSGLFHFKKEKDNSKEPDNISGKLIIENKVIKSIISSLYPPHSDYLFNVLPVEILGSAYEQFLGKQIIVKGSRATIEEKPEVRKAGGVYYTPQYIVEYIVENTVGKLCTDKTPKEVSKLKIVDPACGSGSFLLGAYQYLLTWHIKYYANNKQTGKQKEAVLTPDGSLTTAEKKRILINNIYGVDIDRNAVEVTKLSLLLKCMEGETTASVNTQMTFFNERVLPSLENNIKSGNSLIDVDYYDGQIDYGDEKKIKPFNWERAFPEVFKIKKVSDLNELKWHNRKILRNAEDAETMAEALIQKYESKLEEPEMPYGDTGGFDVVISNPPYVMLQNLETRDVFNYSLKKFNSARYKIDTYQLFTERSIGLLKRGGLLGFITPNTFLKNIHSEPLRKFILDNVIIKEFVLFKYSVFANASVDTCIFLFEKSNASEKTEIVVRQSEKPFEIKQISLVEQVSFKKNNRTDFNLLVSEKDSEVLNKILKTSKPLNNYCNAYFGIQTFDRNKYVSTEKKNNHFEPVIDGANIDLYNLKSSKEFVNYISSAIKSGGSEIIYRQDRICIRQIGTSPIATFVPANIFTLNTVYNVYLREKNLSSIKFLLGIINSKATRFFWMKNNSDEKKTFPKIKKEAILSIPVPTITKADKGLHDEIVRHVNTMLSLNKQKQTTTSSETLGQLNQRIAYTDDKINKLVYELYGLSEEEIGIVEGK